MADVVAAFLQGQQARQANDAHQQQLEENKLRTMVLKHQIDGLKIQDAISARELAKQNLDLLQGQPEADLPTMPAPHAPNEPPTQQGVTPQAGSPLGISPVSMTQRAPVNIPGVEGLGIPGVSVRPQSLEEGIRAKIAEALMMPRALNEGQIFGLPGEPPLMSGNPKPPTMAGLAQLAGGGDQGATAALRLIHPNNETGAQEDQRFEKILTAQKLGQPVTPEDAAWASAYRTRKELVPAATFAMQAPVRNDARTDRTYQQQQARLDKVRTPIASQLDRINRLTTTINQMTPQADALIAPELLSAMAGGSGSGLRMNEAEISRIVGGRSQWESLKATLNQWSLDPSKALSVTPSQRNQMRLLVRAVQAKAQRQVAALDKASNDLVDANDVDQMRRIANQAVQGLETTPEETTTKTTGAPTYQDYLRSRGQGVQP